MISTLTSLLSYLSLTSLAIATTIVAAYFTVHRYVHRFRNIFEAIGLPHVKPRSWLASLADQFEAGDSFKNDLKLYHENGPLFGFFEGRLPCVMVSDPELIKQVLIKDFDSFSDRGMISQLRLKKSDISLFNLKGEHWRHVRHQITPALTPASLKRMQPLIMKTAHQFNLSLSNLQGQDIDIRLLTSCYAMDIISSVAFGFDLDSINNPDHIFVQHARAAFSAELNKGVTKGFMAAAYLFPDLMFKIRDVAVKRNDMHVDFFRRAVRAEVERRLADGRHSSMRPDYLQHLLQLHLDIDDPSNSVVTDENGSKWLKNGLTLQEIIGQAVTFFLAGYETTSSSIALLLFAMAQHPECQDRLFEEINSVLGPYEDPNYDVFQSMPYLDMCINEALRMYTPIGRIERTCVRETQLGGYTIPEGVLIAIPAHAIHMDPNVWENPEQFKPKRFAEPDCISPGSFLPFGHGNRHCIGMRFAMLEIRLAVVNLFRHYRFSVSENMQLPLSWHMASVRRPAQNILLKVENRKLPDSRS